MRTANKTLAAGMAGIVLGASLTSGAAHADLLGSVLKAGGIGVLIKQFQRPINDAVNKLTGNAGPGPDQATKVVPIVSIGQGGYAGAVQVSGPKVQVDQVQAVGQVEGGVLGNQVRLRALIPINTDKPSSLQSIKRIKGVGVSAIVDVKV